MPKGYWIISYRSVADPEALAKYASLAPPVIASRNGRILARGVPSRVYESGDAQRCAIVEFDSLEAAISAYESAAYQEVASILKGAAQRDVRIVEGA